VLATIPPIAHVLTTIWHKHCSSAIFLIVQVVAFIAAAIRVAKDSIPMHLIVFPLTFVAASIGPLIYPLALDIVVVEFSVV